MASYPRSGSSWLRFLILETLLGDSNFEELRFAVPELGYQHLAPAILPDRGRVIKSHELPRSEYRRAIHLVRDPRDVAVSYFRFMQRLGKIVLRPGDDVDASFDRFIDAFIAGRVDAHGTWQQHLKAWMRVKDEARAEVLRVRYEDIHADTVGKVLEIARFLGQQRSRDEAERIAERCTIERMRLAEQRAIEKGDTPFAQLGRTSGIGVINTGRVEGWRERLTGAQVARFSAFAEGLALMGYPPS